MYSDVRYSEPENSEPDLAQNPVLGSEYRTLAFVEILNPIRSRPLFCVQNMIRELSQTIPSARLRVQNMMLHCTETIEELPQSFLHGRRRCRAHWCVGGFAAGVDPCSLRRFPDR